MLEKTSRNGEIDFLRFFFALMIMLYHWCDLFEFDFMKNGYIGVEFFFIVSGFLMAKHAKRDTAQAGTVANRTWKYLLGKIEKFYPYYVSAVLLEFFLYEAIVRRCGARHLLDSIASSLPTLSLTFMGLNENNVFLYVPNSWYLSVLVLSVLVLYPLLLKSYDYVCKVLFPLIAVFVTGYIYGMHKTLSLWQYWTGFCYIGVLRGISEMALGASLFELSSALQKQKFFSENKPGKIFITVIKIACYAVPVAFACGIGDASSGLHAMLSCALGILLSFSNAGYSVPSSAAASLLGKLSLPVFIYHGLFRWTAKGLLGERPVSLPFFLAMLVACFALCIFMMLLTDCFLKKLTCIKNERRE